MRLSHHFYASLKVTVSGQGIVRGCVLILYLVLGLHDISRYLLPLGLVAPKFPLSMCPRVPRALQPQHQDTFPHIPISWVDIAGIARSG